MFSNPINIILNPTSEWQRFSERSEREFKAIIPYLLIMAIIPSASWFYGTTQVGWHVGDGDNVKLTQKSAFGMAVALYIAILIGISAVGYAIHWMAGTYNAKSSVARGIGLATLTATPFLLLGFTGLYPLLYLDLILFIVGISWTAYLLYHGIPIAMKIPDGQSFLYSSALAAVGGMLLICLLGATTILWSYGFQPVFID
ncbi:MAG: DUF1282 family protein [Sinobacterium sp.]|nr:DUF1282 family protein [Sinobacterium sp.]